MHTQSEPETTAIFTPATGRGNGPRERWSTVTFATLCSMLLALSMACGGSSKGTKRYDSAIDKQERCCESLGAGPKRDACLQRIVRIDQRTAAPTSSQLCSDRTGDERTQCEADVVKSVRASKVSRATYACVQRHFVCDAMTGTATKASAQAQLDCINDI